MSLAVGATPQALPLKNRQVGVGSIDLDIVPNEKVYPLFRPMVREQTFDICEMAVVTYIMAHDRKKPISLVAIKLPPHPEERGVAARLEGWRQTPSTRPPFEARPSGRAPQDKGSARTGHDG
ncbi:MAG: hypothetical protein ACXWI1_10315 [Croceibacterium sp.]